MTDLFDPAFIERQQATYPYLDVRVYAAAVREMASHKPVRKPNGLLVYWLKQAARNYRAERARNAAEQAAEVARHAEFWVALLAFTARRQLTPAQVATCLELGLREGYTKLNAQLAPRLRALGKDWPAAP